MRPACSSFLGTGGIELHAPTFTFPEEILDREKRSCAGSYKVQADRPV